MNGRQLCNLPSQWALHPSPQPSFQTAEPGIQKPGAPSTSSVPQLARKKELKPKLGGRWLVIHKPSHLHLWKDFEVKAHLSRELKHQVLWQETHNDLGEQFPLVSVVGEGSTYFPRTSG